MCWYGKSFLHRAFDFTAGEYARTNTERWINKINEIKSANSFTEKEDPKHILDVRFAKGEISKAEYEEMKQVLLDEKS